MPEFDLVCIGCGPAGETAAVFAAEAGLRVAVVECAEAPGGAMVNTGTLPSKALRETALTLSALRRCPVPGLEPPATTRSMPRLMARRLLLASQEHDRIEHAFDRADVTIVHGRGVVAGPHLVEVLGADGAVQRLATRFILIATGSRPFRPSHVPFDGRRVVDADEVLALPELPRRLIVVGGGVIGCEYASILNELGVEVVLVHGRERILPHLDAECGDHLTALLRERGIEILLDAAVESIEALADGVRCRVGGPAPGVRSADVLLWAAGRVPNVEALGLDRAGVETDDRGTIRTDDVGRTAVPSIFAAGDVVGFPALASTSMRQGRLAALAMTGRPAGRFEAAFPMGIYTVPGVSSIGPTEAEAAAAGRRTICGRARAADNARARMLGDEQGLLKAVFDADDGRLLGVTIVGEDATELIHLGQVCIAGGATAADLAGTCFNYPSIARMYREAAEDALRARAAARRGAAA